MLEIDTTNRFLVGMKGDSVVVLLPPTAVLSKQDALTLAAWLVAVSDGISVDGCPGFEEILAAVENT